MIRLILKPGREKSVRAFHPWIFSGAVDRLDAGFKKGDLVRVFSSNGGLLGVGYLNPDSQIAVRMLTFQDEAIDLAFFEKRMERAKELRLRSISSHTNAHRWIHSEGDFLPGLIADRYGDFVVAQFLTAGIDRLKPLIVEAIIRVFQPKGIYERNDSEARRLEGLSDKRQMLWGECVPDEIEIEENGKRFVVDLKEGQKTGFFFDQRENRKLVSEWAKGSKALDCFSYTGGFSVYTACAGALTVTAVESQEKAARLIRPNLERNGISSDRFQICREDVFQFLRRGEELYDLIVLDPPAFCKQKGQISQAARGYKDINLYAMRRLRPGGILFTSSCSSFVDSVLFQKIVFGAAKDAGRLVQIIRKTGHSLDHPINIYHPEGMYLKGFLLRVL